MWALLVFIAIGLVIVSRYFYFFEGEIISQVHMNIVSFNLHLLNCLEFTLYLNFSSATFLLSVTLI